MRLRLSLGTLIMALLATVTAPVAAADPAERVPVPLLRWQPCGPPFECADLVAPLDYRDPSGRRITVKLIRRPALDPARRIGVLVSQPGGPGQEAHDALRAKPDRFPEFDLIAVDPRGVARSEGVRCFATPEQEHAFWGDHPAFPATPVQEPANTAKKADYARRCAQANGDLLRHVSTLNVARDLDLLRRALGEHRLSYWGSSYATYLGMVYANLFPHRVRAMVLSAVVDPRQWQHWALGRNPVATERTWTHFLAACAAAGNRCALAAGGGGPAQVRQVAEAALAKARVSPGEYANLVAGITAALYDTDRWAELAGLLANVAAGRPGSAGMFAGSAAVPAPSAGLDQFRAVQCTDSAYPRDPGRWPELAAESDRRGELFGRMWLHLVDACAHWPEPAERYTGPWHRRTAPILLTNNRIDPTTSVDGARRAERELTGARLVLADGAGHISHSAAMIGAIEEYLRKVRLPPAGTSYPVDRSPFS